MEQFAWAIVLLLSTISILLMVAVYFLIEIKGSVYSSNISLSYVNEAIRNTGVSNYDMDKIIEHLEIHSNKLSSISFALREKGPMFPKVQKILDDNKGD